MTNEFPSWRYGPDGAAEIFERAEDVPAGWVDHPCKCAKPKGGDPSAATITDAAFSAFDHDGDGKPGGSKRKTARKAVSRDANQ